jgi:hypothetical protein
MSQLLHESKSQELVQLLRDYAQLLSDTNQTQQATEKANNAIESVGKLQLPVTHALRQDINDIVSVLETMYAVAHEGDGKRMAAVGRYPKRFMGIFQFTQQEANEFQQGTYGTNVPAAQGLKIDREARDNHPFFTHHQSGKIAEIWKGFVLSCRAVADDDSLGKLPDEKLVPGRL